MPQVKCPADIAVNTTGRRSYGRSGWFDPKNIHITAATMEEPGAVMLCVDGAPGGKISRAILALMPDDMIKVAKELLEQAWAAKTAAADGKGREVVGGWKLGDPIDMTKVKGD